MSRSRCEDGGGGDALDDHRQAEAGAELEDRAAHGAAGRVVLDVGQEVLVHLEDVDRHPDEVGERRPAGAEVVDGDADAELAQDGEVLDHVRVVEQHRLGDLDDQPAGDGRPLVSRALSTSGTSSPLRTWRAETLTATPRSVSAGRRWWRRPRAAPTGRAR